jgi:hypothetical protein
MLHRRWYHRGAFVILANLGDAVAASKFTIMKIGSISSQAWIRRECLYSIQYLKRILWGRTRLGRKSTAGRHRAALASLMIYSRFLRGAAITSPAS